MRATFSLYPLATMIAGDAAGALQRIRAHVAHFPRDAFALQPATNVFGLIGFSGRREREQEVFDLLASLAGDYGDDWWYLGTLGFWHTELGRVEQGLEFNRRSIEANPRNGNAAHGLAHAWYELGDNAAGAAFLERFLSDFPRDAGMHCHLSWHLALFELHSGHPERMWAAYADGVAPQACPLAPPLNTATDSASMLWRAGGRCGGARIDRRGDGRRRCRRPTALGRGHPRHHRRARRLPDDGGWVSACGLNPTRALQVPNRRLDCTIPSALPGRLGRSRRA